MWTFSSDPMSTAVGLCSAADRLQQRSGCLVGHQEEQCRTHVQCCPGATQSSGFITLSVFIVCTVSE